MRFHILLFSICYAQKCHDGQNGSESSLLQLDLRPPHTAPGIIVWSDGRSATGSLKDSLISATGYTYCKKLPETFIYSAPDIEVLKDCIQQGQLLLMVKPQHLHQHGGSLQRPRDFFRAAFQAGFRVVAGSFRENQLARDLSCLELINRKSMQRDPNYVPDHGRLSGTLHFPGIIKSYEALRANYTAGLEAAYEIGYTIVPSSFQELVTDPCSIVQRITKAVQFLDDSKSFSGCKALASHISPAHENQTLESATNAEVASIVRNELLGTPYEWMLDLNAADWPAGTQPPMRVPTWHVHQLISKEGRMFMHLPNRTVE